MRIGYLYNKRTKKWGFIRRGECMEQKNVQLNKFQESVWEIVKNYREDGICNQGGYLSFDGGIDVENLMESIYIATSCEDILRMRIDENDDFYISKYEEYEAGCVENVSFESEEDFHRDMQSRMKQSLLVPDEPLVKVWVANCEEKIFLCGVFHGIVTDGYGVARILSETMKIYNFDRIDKDLYTVGRRGLSDNYFEQQFIDDDRLNSLCAKDTFCNKVDRLLATDKAWIMKNPCNKHEAKEFVFEFKGDLYQAIKDFEREHQVFADAMFSATLAVFVNQVTGSRYSVIEKTQLNRNKSQLELSGMFANTIPQVISIDEEESFSKLCEKIASDNFRLMKMALCSKKEILDYCAFEGQITDIGLSYNNQKFAPSLLSAARNDVFCGFLDIPLKINVYEKEDSFLIQLQYQTGAYSEYEIKQYAKTLEHIFRQACEQDSLVGEFSLGSDKLSISKGVYEARDEYLPTVIEGFIEQVEKKPYDTAFIYEEAGNIKKMDYKIAGDCVCAISSYLKQCGVQRGDTVGIRMKRGVLMPLSILGAFLAEATILPIGIDEDEIDNIELYEKCTVVLDERFLEGEGAKIVEARGQLSTVEEQELYHSPKNAAYLIRTSKQNRGLSLVQITNYSLSIELNWYGKMFGKEGVLMHKAKSTHFQSMLELLYPVFTGVALYLLPEGKETDVAYIADKIKNIGVTHIHFTPSELNELIEKDKWDMLDEVKYLSVSGEVLKPEIVEELKERMPKLKLYNLYGVPQCTIHVAGGECTKGERAVPVGLPADRTLITIRNSKNKPIPRGYKGEIVIAGDLVGEYCCIGEDTEDRYFYENGIRHYRTKDLGWLDEDGNLYYAGRKKIKKQKVEVLEDFVKEVEQVEQVEETFECVEEKVYEEKESVVKSNKAYYVKREGARRLFIVIPYAGGKIDSILPQITPVKDVDILVPDLEVINEKVCGNLRNMYKYIFDMIIENVEKKEQVVTIIGYCVGSVFAMGLYEYFTHMDVALGNLVFCGSLPISYFEKNGELATIWDYAPDKMLGAALKIAGFWNNTDKEEAALFKKEVFMSAKLLKERKKKVCISKEQKLVLVYGRKDKLTLGWNKKYKNWSQYVSGKVSVKCIETCGHYDLLEGYLKTL